MVLTFNAQRWHWKSLFKLTSSAEFFTTDPVVRSSLWTSVETKQINISTKLRQPHASITSHGQKEFRRKTVPVLFRFHARRMKVLGNYMQMQTTHTRRTVIAQLEIQARTPSGFDGVNRHELKIVNQWQMCLVELKKWWIKIKNVVKGAFWQTL